MLPCSESTETLGRGKNVDAGLSWRAERGLWGLERRLRLFAMHTPSPQYPLLQPGSSQSQGELPEEMEPRKNLEERTAYFSGSPENPPAGSFFGCP